MQKTLHQKVDFAGVGLHSGREIHMTILPAEVGVGIVFVRTDLGSIEIPARYDLVSDTTLNTRLGQGDDYVSTIEHLMSAFVGFGITNARVLIDGPEVPILDGSAIQFAEKFWRAGIVEQGVPARVFEVIRPVKFVDDKGAYAEILPSRDFEVRFEIDFENTCIGHQSHELVMGNGVFLRELANCRTFCRLEEVEALQKQGLALGGNLSNALVVDGNRFLNPEGVRRPDEPVRHKMLDAIGDLYLAGGIILGQYSGYKAGHRVTNQLLRKAFAEGALRARDVLPEEVFRLPGYDIVRADICN